MFTHNSYWKIYIVLILVFLAVGAFFMVNVPMPPWASIASSISLILFCLPTFFVTVRWLGRRNAVILFAVLGAYAISIETLAAKTGFPYGHFSYSERLGYRLFGVVPWTVVFAWTPLILAAYAFAKNFVSNVVGRVVAVATLLVLFDLVLDPGAVLFGFWEYEHGGRYYNVPLSNYLGWLVSGLIGASLLEFILWKMRPLLPTPAQLVASAFLTLVFWSFVAFWAGMLIPMFIGFVVVGWLGSFYIYSRYEFDEMVVLVDEDNNPLGTAPKGLIHNYETPLHRAFSIFLFNKNGELLLQKRAEHKKTWAGVWSNSCCGHQMLYEPVEKGAKRRLKFELGLSSVDLFLILKDFRYRAEQDGIVENEICPVLVGRIESEVMPNPLEVAEVKWTSWDQFLQESEDSETKFSPWSIEEAQLLQNDETFREWYKKITEV